MAAKKEAQKNGVERKLIEYSRRPDEEIFEIFKTEPDGLNQVEAAERLEEYGKNIIDAGNENSLLRRIREAIINPFNIVLLIVAGVTLVTDVILAETQNWATFLMLIFVITVSGVISFIQSEKSNNAAQKLQKMISNRINVIRNGTEMEIDIEEAVPGDIVKLASGDMIPGDVRFFETKDLFIDQSQLTGESNPVGWFMFGVISQTLVIHTIRTPKIPFLQDRASAKLTLSTMLVVAATVLIGFTGLAGLFDLPVMVPSFGLWLVALMAVYSLLAQILKKIYIRINKEWV